jgi:hypothetical protein
VSARAELLADRGEAATSEEFFRSRPFLDAEGVTHTLRIDSDGVELLAPLLVREIPAPHRESTGVGGAPVEAELDAISPYGYPGFAPPAGLALDPATIDFAPAGLVTAFVRHTLGASPLAGATERNVVQIADPSLPRKSRMSDRQQIRKNLRRGYEIQIARGPESGAEARAGFLAAYEQTMVRTQAARRYFFGAGYFDRILEAPGTWLALAIAPDGGVAAASIAARSDGFLHYYLSGSADSHLRDSPMKNILEALIDLSTELSLPLNLGGGIAPGDPLEEFKRGFANRELPWHTSELICDQSAYDRLTRSTSNNDPKPGFFPPYRA